MSASLATATRGCSRNSAASGGLSNSATELAYNDPHHAVDREWTAMPTATISPRELFEAVQSGKSIELIDVRTPVEFREVHATIARNCPLNELNPAQLTAGKNGSPVYFICRSGGRGKQACESLAAAGIANAVNVEGGTQAWEQAGLPVVRGKKAVSLERQVRIVAGSIVLIGVALGALVHPYWIGLSAFIGAGLLFSGITDTCGMGMMLARMPWNQTHKSC
jgi:rhodanese-related sulfurtransferase